MEATSDEEIQQIVERPKWRVKILDGGFSTQLSCHVREQIDGDPLWSARYLATNPDDCIKVHMDFLRSGAEILMTNTYQASVGGFMKHMKKTEEESRELIRTAVKLVQTAIYRFKEDIPDTKDTELLVAGSVGPYGAALNNASEFTGSYIDQIDIQEIKNWHRTRIQLLVEAGCDLLGIETIPALAEAQVLLELLKEFPSTKAWLCFVCKDDEKTCYGDDFEKAVRHCWKFASDQLVAIGVNCLAPTLIEPLFQRINGSKSSEPNNTEKIPLIAYPNSGETYNVQYGWIDQHKRERLDKYISKWLELNTVIIGGCCRNYAADINRVLLEVRKWEYNQFKLKKESEKLQSQ